MCDEIDEEYAEPVAVWDESVLKARKQHKCFACEETVSPGQQYRRTACLWDGHWETWKHCMRCARMLDALRDLRRSQGECWGTDMLGLNCGEVWQDPPPEVAALAFALPGEVPA